MADYVAHTRLKVHRFTCVECGRTLDAATRELCNGLLPDDTPCHKPWRHPVGWGQSEEMGDIARAGCYAKSYTCDTCLHKHAEEASQDDHT